MLTKHLKTKQAQKGFIGGLISDIAGVGSGLLSAFGSGGSGSSSKAQKVPMSPAELQRQKMLQDEYLKLLGYKSSSQDPLQVYQQFQSEIQAANTQIKALEEEARALSATKPGESFADTQARLKRSQQAQDAVNDLKASIKQKKIAVGKFDKGDSSEIQRFADAGSTLSQIEGYQSPEQKLQDEYRQQADPLIAEFQQLLKQTLSKDFQQNGLDPAGANVAAQKFVDETYYNQAKASFNDFASKTRSDLSAKAAALGRDPNLDAGTNDAYFQEAGRALRDIDLQRGSQVAQRQDVIGYQRPIEALSRAAGGIGTLQQNSGFLNDLATRAQQNRINLLNGVSGLQQQGFQERYPGAGAGQSSSNQYSPAQNIFGGVATGAGVAKGIGDLLSAGSDKKEYVNSNAGEYTFGGGSSGPSLGDFRFRS